MARKLGHGPCIARWRQYRVCVTDDGYGPEVSAGGCVLLTRMDAQRGLRRDRGEAGVADASAAAWRAREGWGDVVMPDVDAGSVTEEDFRRATAAWRNEMREARADG